MKCPHCGLDLKQTERPNYTCSFCSKKFALDPKGNMFQLHDVLFDKIIEQLHKGGRWYYTLDQLRHRAGRKAARAKLASRKGCLPFVLILGFLACTIGNISSPGPLASFIWGLIVLVLMLLMIFSPYIFPFTSRLPLDLTEFSQGVMARWRLVYRTPTNLLDEYAIKNLDDSTPPPDYVRAVVACPERDVLVCLRANDAPRKLNIQLVPTTRPFSPTEQATLARLQREPELPLLLLHDASPQGCLLPQTIIPSLGLRSQHNIVDLGLRPSQAIKEKMMILGTPLDKNMIALLKKHQTGQPPPADAPFTRGIALSKKEVKWLKRGFYTPILSVTPVRLVKMIYDALQQVAPRSAPPPPDPEEQAQKQAKAIGFMTWPGAS